MESSNPPLQRLTRLVQWVTPIVFVFAAVFAAIGAVLASPLFYGAAGITALYGCTLLLAAAQLRLERQYLAAYLVGGGALVAVMLLTFLEPDLYPSNVVVPLLVTAMFMHYAPPERFRVYLVTCALTIPLIALLGLVVPRTGVLPQPWLDVVRVGLLVTNLILALVMIWQFSSRLQETLGKLRDSNADLVMRHNELTEANALMRHQLDQERQLVELVQTLETPVVPIADGVLLAPLIGAIDSRRAEALHARLLHELYVRRAQTVIVDLSGIPDVDTLVAQQLIRLAQALGLLGAEVVLCGISPTIALTLTHIGIDTRAMRIAATVQDALSTAAAQATRAEARSLWYN